MSNLPSEEVVKYLHDILPLLKLEAMYIEQEMVQEVRRIRLLRQLSHEFGQWV